MPTSDLLAHNQGLFVAVIGAIVFLSSLGAIWKLGFNGFLNRIEETMIATLIACATLIIFVAVCHRYGTGLSINASKWFAARGMAGPASVLNVMFDWFRGWDLSWAQELCTILFVWMAKFGAAYGVRTGVHVGVDVITNAISGASRYWVVLFGMLAGALFTFVIGCFGVDLVMRMWNTSEQTNDLEAPMWIVYLAIPLGSYLMSFRFLQAMWTFSRTGELPHTDESHVEGLDRTDLVPHDVTPASVAGAAR